MIDVSDTTPLGLPQWLAGFCATPKKVAILSRAKTGEPSGQARWGTSVGHVMIDFEYPWYRGGDFGDAIEQGDFFDDFPIYLPQWQFGVGSTNPLVAEFDWEERNVVVMSQTCDMVHGREKLDELLQQQHANRKTLEDMRRGNMPGYHVLASCD